MLYDLLQESANQILSLSTKTLEEMKSDTLAGPLYIGTGQTDNLSEYFCQETTPFYLREQPQKRRGVLSRIFS